MFGCKHIWVFDRTEQKGFAGWKKLVDYHKCEKCGKREECNEDKWTNLYGGANVCSKCHSI